MGQTILGHSGIPVRRSISPPQVIPPLPPSPHSPSMAQRVPPPSAALPPPHSPAASRAPTSTSPALQPPPPSLVVLISQRVVSPSPAPASPSLLSPAHLVSLLAARELRPSVRDGFIQLVERMHSQLQLHPR